jgi:hypothetical protein
MAGNDGSIEIAFAYHNGHKAVLKANGDTFFNSLLRRDKAGDVAGEEL